MLQLLLDLFGDARAEPAPTPVAAPESESNRPSALEQPAPTAIQNIANQPLVQLPDALPAAQFVHPRASRSIRFAHAEVAYEFRRGKRRTIGFQVGPEGLTVSAPRWTPLGEVEAEIAACLQEGFLVDWKTKAQRLFISVQEPGFSPPAWDKVFAEQALVDVAALLRAAGFEDED